MSKQPERRVAVIIDLEWALQHHHGVFVGTQRFAQQHGGWRCDVSPHLDRILKDRGGPRYDGIIARVTPEIAKRARRARIPLVNVYINSAVDGVPTVIPDRAAAGRMAAEHLLARGFRAFAYLGNRRDRCDQLQLPAYRKVIRDAGFRATAHSVHQQNYTKNETTWRRFDEGVRDWIDTWSFPLGVYVNHDVLCRNLANVILRRGLKIPHDVALIGSQNETVICQQPEPSLTSIDFGYERVGYEAAELLERLMAGKRPPAAPIQVVPVGLFPRHSTDVLAVEDPVVAKAIGFIAEQGHRAIRVPDIAEHVALTRRSLERRFRTHLGRTIAAEITRLRLERAKRLLVETDDALGKLAVDAGFADAKRLYQVFMRLEGTSPTEYRRQRQWAS